MDATLEVSGHVRYTGKAQKPVWQTLRMFLPLLTALQKVLHAAGFECISPHNSFFEISEQSPASAPTVYNFSLIHLEILYWFF